MIVRRQTVDADGGTLDDDGLRKLRQVNRVCKCEKEKELTIDGSRDEKSEDTCRQRQTYTKSTCKVVEEKDQT